MLLLEFFANLVLSHRVGINGALGWMIAVSWILGIGITTELISFTPQF